MKLFQRKAGTAGKSLPVIISTLCTLAVIFGTQNLVPEFFKKSDAKTSGQPVSASAGEFATVGYHLLDAAWTTADIVEKGYHPFKIGDSGLVVMYSSPPGHNPKSVDDWIGIYKLGQLNTSARIDWDYVCPNDEARCYSFGAAAIPAGDNGMQSGQTYTVAYWKGGTNESNSTPLATLEYVVPW